VSALAQKKIIEETQYIVSKSSSAIPVEESSVIPFAIITPRKQRKRIEDIKMTAQELIAYLADKEAGNDFYKLSFTADARGPVFGPLQLDLATDSTAQAMFSHILTTSGVSPAYIKSVIEVAEGLCSINATSEEQKYLFTAQIAGGNTYEGEAMLRDINTLLAQNASYINAESSHVADEMADEVNEYLAAVGYSGIPKADVARFLAKLVKLTGTLDFLKQSGSAGTITGPVTVANIKAMLRLMGRMDTVSLWSDVDNKPLEASFSDDCGNWYVVERERAA